MKIELLSLFTWRISSYFKKVTQTTMLSKQKKVLLQYINEFGTEALLENLVEIVNDNSRHNRDSEYLSVLKDNLDKTLEDYQARYELV